jgi:ABC-type dipeptide/oligopeptide/nickel transport system permease component
MKIALLVCTAVFVAAGALLTIRSIRRDTALDSFAAFLSMLGAGVPAAAYGALAG